MFILFNIVSFSLVLWGTKENYNIAKELVLLDGFCHTHGHKIAVLLRLFYLSETFLDEPMVALMHNIRRYSEQAITYHSRRKDHNIYYYTYYQVYAINYLFFVVLVIDWE